MYLTKLNSGDESETEAESIVYDDSESSEQKPLEEETCENNEAPEKRMGFISNENLEEELKALEEEQQIDIEELRKRYLKKDCEKNKDQDVARRDFFVIESGGETKMSIISLPSYFKISESDDDPDYEPESEEDEQQCFSDCLK
ncbi:hypothetical protein T07_5163 [Trichinella nelsoni]|uniref:Uncharacterized protein n=1 Tax=Trichinella nelsoni TaxID=6336 RepID=A0A0V0SMF5_9BILA|nr:hypothetical protein T07_5163 [Trichinella nelsoni]